MHVYGSMSATDLLAALCSLWAGCCWVLVLAAVAHFVGSSLGPTVFALVCTWLGFKFHRVVLDRV